MKKTIFDVLIVYSEQLADSATCPSADVPFGTRSKNELYNEVYGYFMQMCHQHNLKVAFTTSADIISAGLCKSYWIYSKGVWKKVNKPGYARMIFDKLAPTTASLAEKRNLLFSKKNIKPFNHPRIYKLFLDKYLTFTQLQELTIPTASIAHNTSSSAMVARQTLHELMDNHPQKHDFSDEIIMKDRYGAGGNNIYRFRKNQEKEMVKVLKENKNRSFIIQPFTKFNKGFIYQDKFVSADIRLIFLRGKIVQTYVRMAKKESYLCNEHQGATLRYLKKGSIPKKVFLHAKKILELIHTETSLFALDFVMSNNGNPYLLEGNTGPGLDWNPNIQQNIVMSKNFITMIVKELGRLIDNSLSTPELDSAIILHKSPVLD